jgi:probable rRNA maturation factor
MEFSRLSLNGYRITFWRRTEVVILQKRVAGLSEKSLERFVLRARRAAGLRGLTNVLVTTSAEVRSLNRRFRGKNQATDVLSFPSPLPVLSGGRRRAALAGEIAVSADIAARNAASLGHSAAKEVKVLALHGILHLAGFDHEGDNGQMARKEMQLRRLLKLPVALIERTQGRQPKSLKKARGAAQLTRARRLA